MPPKKVLSSDLPGQVVRKPLEVRPLTLNNTDNKHTCGVSAQAVLGPIREHINPSQRGFVPGRQMLQNVLELDVYSRISAFRCHAHRKELNFRANIPPHSVASLAVTVLTDFSTAFASVSHGWLFSVLEAISVPGWFLRVVKNRYQSNEANLMQEGCSHFLFKVNGGVMQGCPLSAVLFLFAIDPLLWLLSQAVVAPGFGKVFAAADDIGIVLHNLCSVGLVGKAFALFARVSNLTLQPAKCKLILNSCATNANNTLLIEQWLSEYVPSFSEFDVCNRALYLGFFVGPSAGSVVWNEPLKKFNSRVNQIYSLHEPPAVALRQYHSKAVSTLGYVSQLSLPPSPSLKPKGKPLERYSILPPILSLCSLYIS